MRILFLHSSSDVYGASKIFLQTVSIAKRSGHHVVVVLSKKGELEKAFLDMDIPVEIINLGILRRQYFNLKGIINRYQQWTKAITALGSIIQSHQVNLVYSNTAAVLIGAYIARKHSIKHIWHIHEIIEKPIFLHRFLSWCFKNFADQLILVSKAVEEHWQKGIEANKIKQIYNGIEPVQSSSLPSFRTSLNIPTNALVIGMAARIHYWKGQSYFVEIANAMLAMEDPTTPLYFLIAGDPFTGYEYLLDQLMNQIQQLKRKDQIIYLGLVKEMDVFYRSIDLLILPSQLPDPLPTVILEAMQYQIPVVATKQGGAMEMVKNNETGIFIPLDNASEAAQKIYTILPEKIRLSMGSQGKKRVDEHFSQASFEKNILALLDN